MKKIMILLLLCTVFILTSCTTNESTADALEQEESLFALESRALGEPKISETEPDSSPPSQPSQPQSSQAQQPPQSQSSAQSSSTPSQQEESSRNNTGTVDFILIKTVFDHAPDIIEAIITNGTNEPVVKSLGYEIEYDDNGSWSFIFESTGTLELEYIQPNESISLNILITKSGTEYPNGKYRVRLFGMNDLSVNFTIGM